MPFGKTYDSGNRAFCLHITITLKDNSVKKKFRVWAEDKGRENSKYADREIIVDSGKRTIFFSFVVSPKQLFIGVVNCEEPNDGSFDITLMEGPLKTYDIQMDDQTKRFVQFALNFSQRCGFEIASESGRPYVSNPEEFVIKYFPVIVDRLSGQALNTPARIGHQTGYIDVSKHKFDNYTVAMRMIILLHEYSHKYRNPKIGLQISNEKGADVNALYIFLGLGFSVIDAVCCFAMVFYKAQTEGNIQRMRLISDYSARFQAGEFAQPNN